MKRSLLAVCIVLAFAAGCTLPGSQPATPAPQVTADQTRQKIAASLRAGRYTEALTLIRAERGNSRATLSEEYLRALQALASVADSHSRLAEAEAAGKAWRSVLDHYPEEAAVASRFGRSRAEIEAHLQACADRLIERGLAQYRAGDLEAAIGTWKRILLFDAGHQGARKNIQTADLQLRKLRSLP